MYIFFYLFKRVYYIIKYREKRESRGICQLLLVFLDKMSYWMFIFWGNVKLDDKSFKYRKYYKDIIFFLLKYEKQWF